MCDCLLQGVLRLNWRRTRLHARIHSFTQGGILQQALGGARAGGYRGGAPSQVAEQRRLANDAAAAAAAAPGPVGNLRVGVGENTMDPQWGQLELYWDRPTTGGQPRAYRVYVDDRLVGTVDTIDAFIRHLHEGQLYKFGVSGVNTWGEGPIQYVTETFQALPGAFRFVQAVPGDGTIDLYWEDPYFDGGAYFLRATVLRPVVSSSAQSPDR